LSGERLSRELLADGVVHALGLALGIVGAAALVGLAVFYGNPVLMAPLLVYAAGLVAMLGCSAAYNLLRSSRRRDWLRRFDHAAIFAMIAGTYTPFTILGLQGGWSSGLTVAIWSVAAIGIALKLWQPRRIEAISVALYLGLGWIGLIALHPFMVAFDTATLALLATGGILYSVGVVFHLWRWLPFHNAIWHGFVLVAAGLHYCAILTVIPTFA
jgi:hemolysin III